MLSAPRMKIAPIAHHHVHPAAPRPFTKGALVKPHTQRVLDTVLTSAPGRGSEAGPVFIAEAGAPAIIFGYKPKREKYTQNEWARLASGTRDRTTEDYPNFHRRRPRLSPFFSRACDYHVDWLIYSYLNVP